MDGCAPTQRFLLIGDAQCADFVWAVSFLKQHGQVVAADTCSEAVDSWPHAEPPSWIVLACSGRDQFSSTSIAQLYHAFALTPIVMVYGAWCEGETRSGSPPRGALRMHWSAFAAEMGELLPSGRRPPPTESDVERMERRLQWCVRGPWGVAAIWAVDYETYAALADVAESFGLAATWWRGEPLFHRQLSALIWDSPLGQTEDVTALQAAAAAHPRSRTVLVTGFPRAELVQAARQAGLDGVIRKPFVLSDWRPVLGVTETNARRVAAAGRHQRAA